MLRIFLLQTDRQQMHDTDRRKEQFTLQLRRTKLSHFQETQNTWEPTPYSCLHWKLLAIQRKDLIKPSSDKKEEENSTKCESDRSNGRDETYRAQQYIAVPKIDWERELVETATGRYQIGTQ